MDLLLQAARVLEENSGVGSDRTASRSTRGTSFHGSPKGKGDHVRTENRNRNLSGSSVSLDGTAEDDSGLAGEKRRAGGAGTREVHNQLEKNRRKQMRECFNQLQQCIPSLENKRVATHSILQGAIKHIKNLKKKDGEQEKEIQTLAKKKSDFKKKYDTEFHKCSAEQQRKAAEVMMKVEKIQNHTTLEYDGDEDEDEEGNATDSTSTASEGPGNEDNFSDDEKSGCVEKPHISRVNPIVAAKLDGFRKRKLATSDIAPKSADFIIAPMSDAGFMAGMSAKQKPAALSSVSSSSVALKNMLEQKKRHQTGFTQSIVPGAQSILEQPRPKVVSATKISSSKGVSSLTSSHPMISNQLASATSIPMPVSSASVLANAVESPDRLTQVAHTINSPGSNFSPLKSRSPAVLSLTSLQNKIQIVASESSPQSVLLNSSPANSIMSAVLPRSTTVAQEVANAQLHSRTRASSLTLSTGDTFDNEMRVHASFASARKSPPVLARPVNFFIENSSPVGKSNSGLMATLPNHTSSPSPILPHQQPVSPASSNKVVPAVYPLSLIQGLALNHNVAPGVAVTSVMSPCNAGLNSGPPGPLISAVSPMIQPKIHPPEILIASPVKTDSISSGANPNAGRVTTLLAAASQATNPGVIKSNPTFVGSLPMSNVSSPVTSPSMVTPTGTMALPEGLKAVTLTPTILPFTVTAGHLPASTTSISHGAPLRFFTPLTPNSVVPTPLTNGQTSLMPAVVQLDGSGQVTVLQNFVQLQTTQMVGQPIVVVTSPNSMIAPVTSTTGPVNVSHTASSSSASLV